MSKSDQDFSDILSKKPEIGISSYEAVVAEFDLLCETSQELFREKNRQYGNAIVTTGVLGASIELIGAVARLRELVLKDQKHGATNIALLVDVFMDIHNYSNIAMIMLRDNNWDGV
jgi:hypothetical protein